MAKSKNHTNHNQGHKNHKNGIKKPRRQKYISTKGMHQKFVLNQRYARAGSEKALRAQKKKAAAAAAAAPAAANAAAPATDKQ